MTSSERPARKTTPPSSTTTPTSRSATVPLTTQLSVFANDGLRLSDRLMSNLGLGLPPRSSVRKRQQQNRRPAVNAENADTKKNTTRATR